MEWISTKERLPEKEVSKTDKKLEYLIYWKGGITMAYWNNGHSCWDTTWCLCLIKDVTHWMPLLSPPEET